VAASAGDHANSRAAADWAPIGALLSLVCPARITEYRRGSELVEFPAELRENVRHEGADKFHATCVSLRSSGRDTHAPGACQRRADGARRETGHRALEEIEALLRRGKQKRSNRADDIYRWTSVFVPLGRNRS
jgi:hypothetical protein